MIGHHGPSDDVLEECLYYPSKLNVHHFKWRGNVLENHKNRVNVLKRLNHYWKWSQKVLDYYEEHGSFLELE